MFIEQVDLVNFRNYASAQLQPSPEGVTLLEGGNGAGKTNLLEAIGYAATLRSFRGTPSASLVRNGESQAVVRVQAERAARSLLVEIELNLVGKDKVKLNRQPLRRNEDLWGAVIVTVFSPDDIEVVKGGPQLRRDYLDQLLSSLHPKHSAAQHDLERVLRQRNALLRSAGGALRPGMSSTLDVWDTKLAFVGEQVASARESLVVPLVTQAEQAYQALSGPGLRGSEAATVVMRYERSWEGDLQGALAKARAEDVRRGLTSVGPQRDELTLFIGGLAARTQASQGEQRSLALALRLGAHSLATSRHGSPPVLLLDDIFSELDPVRSAALARALPRGQTLLTAAGPVPADLVVGQRARVVAGVVGLV